MFLKYMTKDWLNNQCHVSYPCSSFKSCFSQCWEDFGLCWLRTIQYQKAKNPGSTGKINQIRSQNGSELADQESYWQMTATCRPFTKRIQFAENNAWRICMQAVSEGRLTQWFGLHEEADSLRSSAFLRRKSRTSAII